MTARALESHKTLFVDLYHMCGSVMKCVMVHYIARRCDIAHVRGITLIYNRFPEQGLLRNPNIWGGGEGVEDRSVLVVLLKYW